MKFAKLYERDGRQVLVKIDQHPETDNPEVRFYFKPEGLGVCSTSARFKGDSDESWDECEKLFEQVNEAEAFKFVDGVEAEIKAYTGIDETEVASFPKPFLVKGGKNG